MDKGDARPPSPGSCRFVHEPRPLLPEMAQGDIDGGHHEGDVVEPLTPTLQEPSHRGVRAERLQQLDERSPDRDHRLFHPLGFDGLSIQRLDPITLPIAVERRVQVVYGYGDMIQVEQLHDREAIDRDR